jgi:arginine decarboxylase
MPAEELYLPIYNSISEYLGKGLLPFHMPGHKLGKGFPEQLAENLVGMDITELPGTDNLHHPAEAIKEAQELAARAFKADRSYFLVNGSTCGIHAMIMTICKPGERLIVARDCHKSVINGLFLAGAEPVYIKPYYDSCFGMSTVVSAEDVCRALDNNPDAVGVMLTRPTYYGVCSDIAAIAEQVHKRGKILAVDEAHGPHLCFHSELPISAMEAGADICVQSAHKTLPALTQGAYLHVKVNKDALPIDIERLGYILSAIQTSSPSYPVMVSLDAARAIMMKKGFELLDGLIGNCRRIRKCLSENGCLYSPGPNDIINGNTDETRLVVNFSKAGLTGYQAEAVLRREFRIQPEMSDIMNVVVIATVSDSGSDLERLGEALSGLSHYEGRQWNHFNIFPVPPDLPQASLGLKEALNSSYKLVELREARGRICWNMITPYPPGIPVVNPGETINESIIEYIEEIIKAGGNVTGLADNRLAAIVT